MAQNLEARKTVWYYRSVIAGKLYRKSTGFRVGTRESLRCAQRRAAEIENEIRSGTLGWTKPEIPLFHVWAEQFLVRYHPNRYTERLLMDRPKRRWADRPLNTINESEVRAYLNARKADGAKPGTLERERHLLSACFRAAVRNRFIDDSPMEDIGCIRRTPKTSVLTKEHEPLLRAILSPEWDRYLTIALGTGVRRSELAMMRPMDLRDGGTFIWIRPESNKLRKGRLVPLRPEVVKALEAQRAERGTDERVTYFGFKPQTASIQFKQWCRKINIPVATPHAFRRTFGTRCAQAGMYPKHLQLIMGHASVEITMKFYVHLEQQSLLDAMQGIAL